MESSTFLSPGRPSAYSGASSHRFSDAKESLVRRIKTAAADTALLFNPNQYKPLMRHSMRVLGGVGVTAMSSLALGATIAEPLARMARESNGATPLFESIPWAGKFINELLGKAGALGAMATAAPLLGLALTLVQSQGQGSDRAHWLFTHLAMGMSASPIWILPLAQVSGALPALLIAGACMVGVSVLLSERLSAKQASIQMLLVGVSLVLGGAPMPALLVTGASAAHAATYGALILSAGASVLACYTMYSSFAALADDSTAELRSHAVKTDLSNELLNLPGVSLPNVFCFNQTLIDHVQYIKSELDAGRRLDVQTMLLSGPPGTGKTAISRAIGHALGAKTYLMKPSEILGSDNPAQKVRSLFAQAKTLGGRAVFYFDDSEALFPNRKAEGKFDQGFDTRTLLTTTFNDCIDGIEKDGYELLMVVVSTNNRAYLDHSIRQRFATCDVDILPPDRQQAAEVLQALYRRNLLKQGSSRYRTRKEVDAQGNALELSQRALDYILDTLGRSSEGQDKLEVAGREFDALCVMVLRNMSVHQGLQNFQNPTEKQVLKAFRDELPKFIKQLRDDAKLRKSPDANAC